jgi:hypothetical protein
MQPSRRSAIRNAVQGEGKARHLEQPLEQKPKRLFARRGR